ncbi:hypothetical protein Pth03_52550 [Planotetraspora thailandica]|uniref:Uncharacterized protein n=1 Tax=Planotetraspora thailandica TaxID=487172 RepID=A0A8J3V8J9_9ACTN|nr:hypothetical protein Pth03_52550 [Planotetraspora thailandica]
MVSFLFAKADTMDATGGTSVDGAAALMSGGTGSCGMTVDAGSVAVTVPESAAAGSALKAPTEAVSATLLRVIQAMRNSGVELVDRGLS